MSVEVKLPDPLEQYAKTPVYQLQPVKYGEEAVRFVRKLLTVDDRVVTLKRLLRLFRDLNYTQLKQLYFKLSGKEYSGTSSKKGVVKALFKHYFKRDADGTLSEILKQFYENIHVYSRWGLGCPHGCGRFWWFKVENGTFVPVDDRAYKLQILDEWDVKITDMETGEEQTVHYYKFIDENGNEKVASELPLKTGYLQWEPLEDGSVRFRCDRCGKEIVLVK